MKNYLFLVFSLFIIGVVGCKKETVFLFDDENELFFEKFYTNENFPGKGLADSTKVSFFFYPDGAQNAEASIVVNLSGKLLSNPDMKFNLKVVSEETTANSDEFTIDPSYTFKPFIGPSTKEIKDTIQIKLHRSPRLDQLPEGVRLVLELVPTENYKLGQTERIRSKIILTTLASQPDWWNSEVTTNLLGKYSQKKFKLFLNEIDKKAEVNGQFIRERPDLVKKMVLQFKSWLTSQSPRIMEDSGEVMEVAI